MAVFRKMSREEFTETYRYGGLEKENYLNIKDNLYNRNIKNMTDICFFLMIYTVAYLLLVLAHVIDNSLLVPYWYIGTVTLLYFIVSHFSIMKNRRVGMFIYDCFICLLFLFATMLGTRFGQNHMAVTFQVILVLLPFVYIDTPRRSIPLIIVNMAIFMALTLYYKEGKTEFNDIFNTGIFGLLAMYCTFKITSKLVKEFAYEQMIEYENKFDGLTRVFTKNVAKKMIIETLQKQHGVLLIIDIDHFKGCNDTYGHLYGDEVLVKVANALKSSFRKDDIIGRFGGDEFVVFMKNTSAHEVQGKVEAYQEELKRIFADRPVTCSIGIAEARDGISYDTLLKNADHALYYSKESGRNQYHMYTYKKAS